MKKNHWKRGMSLALALVLVLVGCAGGNQPASSETPASQSTAQSSSTAANVSANGKDELVIAMGYDASSLDPVGQNEVAASNAMKNIFENLLILDEKGNAVPQLALSWDVKDNQHYTFKLREGVKFSNGETMTSADVKFTLERAAEAAPVSEYFKGIDLTTIQTPDDNTISFSLKAPNSVFLSYMSHSGAMIVNKKAVEEAGTEVGLKPVGTGPYVLNSWSKNDKIVYDRNENYWGEPAKFKKLTMRTITEQPNRAIELETGNVDIAYELAPSDLERIEANDKLVLQKQTIQSLTYLGFNTKLAPYDNLKVRQAIQAALPLEDMVNATFMGLGAPTDGFVPPDIKYSISKTEVPAKDVEKAKALLKEAGFENGFDAKIMVNENPFRIKLATIMKEELAAVGINLTIESLEWGAFLEKIKDATQYEMYILGWTTAMPDPDTSLYALLHGSASAAGSNYSHYENPEFDKLLDDGRLISDGPERQALYEKAQKMLQADLPSLPLANTLYADGQQAYVEGFVVSPIAINYLYPVYFK